MIETKNTEATTAMPKAFQERFFTVVPDDQRSDYLPSQFNNNVHDSGLFERELFRTAGYFCDKNMVLKWEMASVKSDTGDTFFMYPSIDDQYLISGLDVVDNKLFGLIMTLIALDEGADRSAMEQEFSDILINHHHALHKAIDSCMATMDDGNDDKLRSEFISMFEVIRKYA